MKKTYKIILVVLLTLLVIAGGFGYRYYKIIFDPNVIVNTERYYLYIPTGSSYEDVLALLKKEMVLKNYDSFEWVAEKKNYHTKVKPGRYRLKKGMSNNELVNMLRAGLQEPIQITFNNVRHLKDLAGRVGKKFETDSTLLLQLLLDNKNLSKVNLTHEEALLMCMPNTYEFYWNTSAQEFVDKMIEEYIHFWNDERKNKAKELGLSPAEVGVLAAIVQSETNKPDEMSRVAGVYLNRIHKGMLLQADPTLIFAIGDYTIRRVLNIHKEIESPYNTYKYVGLPPGPIIMPNIITLEKVLSAEKHDYIYFCAKEDLSGYHNFSRTIQQHLQYANMYQRELDRLNIKK